MEMLPLPGIKTYPGTYVCRLCGRKKKADKYLFDKRYGTRRTACIICERKLAKNRAMKRSARLGKSEVARLQREYRKGYRRDRTKERENYFLKQGRVYKRIGLKQTKRLTEEEKQSRRVASAVASTNRSAARAFNRCTLGLPFWYKEYFAGYHQEVWAIMPCTNKDRFTLKYMNIKEFAISERVRRQINKKKKGSWVADIIRVAINNGGRSNKVESQLGYTISDLKEHLGAKFTDGMNWEAFRSGQIHIDHVKPQRLFDCQDDKQFRQCWSLDNLQPLWARDNLTKGGKYNETR